MSWKFKCSLCGKKFNNKEQSDNHVARHTSGGKQAKSLAAEYELQERSDT